MKLINKYPNIIDLFTHPAFNDRTPLHTGGSTRKNSQLANFWNLVGCRFQNNVPVHRCLICSKPVKMGVKKFCLCEAHRGLLVSLRSRGLSVEHLRFQKRVVCLKNES